MAAPHDAVTRMHVAADLDPILELGADLDRDALDAVVAGRPIAEGETRFLGCTIKFRD